MTQFLRPAARETLWRYRDVIAAAAVILLGLWWSTTFFSPVRWLGYAIIALGTVWALGAFQRLRFHQNDDGPGTVKVVERRLAYFGPLTGGVIDMDDATELSLEPDAHPAPHWIIRTDKAETLEIPINAEGADVLFDLFASLPGIETEKMLKSLNDTPDQRCVIWTRTAPLLH